MKPLHSQQDPNDLVRRLLGCDPHDDDPCQTKLGTEPAAHPIGSNGGAPETSPAGDTEQRPASQLSPDTNGEGTYQPAAVKATEESGTGSSAEGNVNSRTTTRTPLNSDQRDSDGVRDALSKSSSGVFLPREEPSDTAIEASENLHPQHARLLRESGISKQAAAARGYRTVTVAAELHGLGFAKTQCLVPALLIPLHGPDGELGGHQIRPDTPREIKGKLCKYEVPKGSRLPIDVPPLCLNALTDPKVPLFLTEGIRKADSAASRGLCCLGLIGVWGWKNKDLFWKCVPLEKRKVYVVYDSDITTNTSVRKAADGLCAYLASRGAEPKVLVLPETSGGPKVGLDDFFASGKTVQDLHQLAAIAPLADASGPGANLHAYQSTPLGLFWDKPGDGKKPPLQLTNFVATITADVRLDDGVEKLRQYEVTAHWGGKKAVGRVPAEQFERMNWPATLIGPEGVVFPGIQTRDHARAAIQLLSGKVPTITIYSSLGWIKDDHGWAYIHAGGAIRAEARSVELPPTSDRPDGKFLDGNDLNRDRPIRPISIEQTGEVQTHLPDALACYCLPAPPIGEDLVNAVKASLHFLDSAPDRISFPLYLLMCRSVLGPTDFSGFVVGPTGVFKSAYVALIQQHWGAGLDDRHLPGSWNSTANSLAELAFRVKDGIIVVDDFVPKGTAGDVERQNKDADLLLRAQGNRSGRGRLTRDGSLREGRPPRGLILCTGEVLPQGQSLNARMLTVEIGPGDIMPELLTRCQKDARAGFYAQSMAGYLSWLAARYDDVVKQLPEREEEMRNGFASRSHHRRGASMLAALAAGFEYYLDFAQEMGAIDEAAHDAYWDRMNEAFHIVVERQGIEQEQTDPVNRFFVHLGTALRTGRAHLESGDGKAPDEYGELVGWQRFTIPATEGDPTSVSREVWRKKNPASRQVGWIFGDDLFLLPGPAVAIAVELAGEAEAGNRLHLTDRVAGKRLDERGLLMSKEEGRYSIKKTIDGAQTRVLHLNFNTVIELCKENSYPNLDLLTRYGSELLGETSQ